jgi:hypothetical protein
MPDVTGRIPAKKNIEIKAPDGSVAVIGSPGRYRPRVPLTSDGLENLCP